MAISTDQLKRVPLFAGLQDKDLKSIAGSMHERTFNAGDSPTVPSRARRRIHWLLVSRLAR